LERDHDDDVMIRKDYYGARGAKALYMPVKEGHYHMVFWYRVDACPFSVDVWAPIHMLFSPDLRKNIYILSAGVMSFHYGQLMY
jgi:hypothetical protein